MRDAIAIIMAMLGTVLVLSGAAALGPPATGADRGSRTRPTPRPAAWFGPSWTR